MADVVNLGNIQIANAVSVVYTAGDNITISDDRVISAIVPTKTSDLDNDSGYITNNVDDLVNYTTTSQLNTLLSEKANVNDVYTKTESDSRYPLSTNVYSKTESDSKYSTIPETGNKIEVSINSSTYVMTMNLKDKNNNILSTGTVDLPLESVVVNGRYDDTTKELILTLQNGNEIKISVADLISGLQETLIAGNNIQINGNVISATDTTYTAGENVTITGTTISAKDTTYTAGENVTITGTTISAKDTTYELSGETEDDVTTLTLTDSDGGSSTATVDCSKYQEELDTLNEIVDGLPHVEGEGTELSLSPTIKAPLKSTLKGNTTQTTYSGKNLFNKSVSQSSANGTTATELDTGIRATTTSTGANKYVAFNLPNPSSLLGKSLTISATISASGTNNGLIRFYWLNGNTLTNLIESTITATGSQTFSIPNAFPTDNDGIAIVFSSNASSATSVVGNYIDYTDVQLEESATATTYEPYVGGVPSPNPDYPQKVKVVTGDNTVKISGKNLFDGTYYNMYTAGASPYKCTSYADARAGVIKVKPNTDYTIQKSVSDRFRISMYTEYPVVNTTYATSYIQAGDSSTSYTVTTSNDTEYLFVQVSNSGQDGVRMMVEEGSTATTYEPYTSQTYTLNLGSLELCKIGDYQDSFIKQDGKWYKNEVINKTVYVGSDSEPWGYDVNSHFFTIACGFNFRRSGNIPYCNYFTGQTNVSGGSNVNEKHVAFNYAANKNNMYIKYSEKTTAADFKTWLTTHNTVVYCILTTPTTTEITDSTLISQLEAIASATSYNTQTNITSTYATGNEPIIISASALYDLGTLISA